MNKIRKREVTFFLNLLKMKKWFFKYQKYHDYYLFNVSQYLNNSKNKNYLNNLFDILNNTSIWFSTINIKI